MKDIIKIINDNLMPSGINKEDEDYKIIWGDKDFTPLPTIVNSPDYKCGAICNELEYLRAFIAQITSEVELDDLKDEYLEKIGYFMLRLEKNFEETDDSFRNKIKALAQRNGNTSWMTKWCMIDVFSYFFPIADLYCINNIIESDLIANGDFETGDFTSWTATPGGGASAMTVESAGYFEGGECCKFANVGDPTKSLLTQTLSTIGAGTYVSHFFYKDDGNSTSSDPVQILFQRTSDSFYWNFDTEAWQSGFTADVQKSFPAVSTADRYEAAQAFFVLTGSDSVIVGIRNDNVTDTYDLYIDRVTSGEKEKHPSFYLYAVTSADAGGYMNAWEDGADPMGAGYVYTNAGFLNNDYILGSGASGTTSLYDEILDIIKPAGVLAEFEIIEREV